MTSRPDVRFKEHASPSSTCTKLKNSIQKHGIQNFTYEILCVGSEEYILDLEEKAIISYDSMVGGYNLVLGNPRTGAMLLSDEMKLKISDGLNRYHSENVAWNRGITIGKRKPYDPHYVSGFWFPHLETASMALGRDIVQLHKWRREDTLGDVQRLRENSIKASPAYVAGFWFDSLYRASDYLGQEVKTLHKRIKDGNVEQKNNSEKQGKSENGYHMTGKKGFAHHKSIAVEINGVIYGSISLASEQTEFTKKMIYTRLKNNTPGFAWV